MVDFTVGVVVALLVMCNVRITELGSLTKNPRLYFDLMNVMVGCG